MQCTIMPVPVAKTRPALPSLAQGSPHFCHQAADPPEAWWKALLEKHRECRCGLAGNTCTMTVQALTSVTRLARRLILRTDRFMQLCTLPMTRFAAVGPARWSILLDRAARLDDHFVTQATEVHTVVAV